MIPAPEQVAVAHALCAYIYNTSGVKFAEDVFGKTDPRDPYVEEKATRWGESPIRAIGYLDEEHFKKFVGLALEKYGDEGKRRAGL